MMTDGRKKRGTINPLNFCTANQYLLIQEEGGDILANIRGRGGVNLFYFASSAG